MFQSIHVIKGLDFESGWESKLAGTKTPEN